MRQRQHAQLLIAELKGRAPLPQIIDPRKKGSVIGDLRRIGRQHRREFPLQRIARLVRIGT